MASISSRALCVKCSNTLILQLELFDSAARAPLFIACFIPSTAWYSGLHLKPVHVLWKCNAMLYFGATDNRLPQHMQWNRRNAAIQAGQRMMQSKVNTTVSLKVFRQCLTFFIRLKCIETKEKQTFDISKKWDLYHMSCRELLTYQFGGL